MGRVEHMTFLGHSTVHLEIGGQGVLTDPILFERVTILRRVVEPVDPVHYRDVDLVVISHLHLDHLDLRSLALLGRHVPLLVPAGSGAWLRRQGFPDATEMRAGDVFRLGDLRVTATPALHDGFRPPFGPRAMALGYLFEADDASVYFAGDTDVFEEMADLAPALDLALLPVWGWGPRLGPGHMDPARAAHAAELLRARIVVPIHWGTLWPLGLDLVRPGRRLDPPHEFMRAAAERGLSTEILLTPPGQRVPFRT
jgi:L-ascorbate metabolism protein UlaG (beta-lactamase superfamily)